MRGSAGSGTSAQRALYISVRSHMPFFTVSTARNGCSAVRNSSVAARIDGTESCRRGQVTRGWIALTYSHPANQPTYGVSVAADDAVVRPDGEGEPALVLQGPGVFAGGREQGGLPRPPGPAHLAVQDLRQGRGLSAARVAPEAAVGDVLPAVAVQRDHHRREHIMIGSKCIHTQEGEMFITLKMMMVI